MLAGRSLVLPHRRERPIHSEIMRSSYQQLFGRESRDDFMTGLGDDNFLLDPSGAPSIARGPERFECENHARFDLVRMLQRYQTADHRFFPNGQANAIAVLQREARLFVRETELLGSGPDGGD